MTGGRSFAALNTAGNSLSNSTPKAQVPFALPTAGGLPAGGVRETAAADEEESTATAREEESTATAREEESTATVDGVESTTAAGRIPHLLKVLPPSGLISLMGGICRRISRRRRRSTTRSKAARKSAPRIGKATFALRNCHE